MWLLFLDVHDRLLRDVAECLPEFDRCQFILDEMRQEGASKVAELLIGYIAVIADAIRLF